MNRSELIEALASRHQVPRRKAELAVHTIFGAISRALSLGERVEVRGFGSFSIRSYEAYTGRNPRTGQSVRVPPKRLPHFKVGKALRELIDG